MQTNSEEPVESSQPLTAFEKYFVQIGQNDSQGLMHVKSVLRLQGDLDIVALENAVDTVVRQNQALRTSFPELPGVRANRPRLARVISPHSATRLEIVDLSGQSDEQRPKSIGHARNQEHKRQFDLERDPLFHFTLLKSTEQEFYLFITLHHAIADIWSLNIVMNEIAKHYNSFHADKNYDAGEKEVDFSDYLQWYDRQASPEMTQRALKFWADYLDGFAGNDFRHDHAGNTGTDIEPLDFLAGWNEFKFTLPESLSEFSKKNGLLPVAAPLLALGSMLSAYSRRDKIYITNTISGRFSSKYNDVVGLLVRMLLTKIAVAPEKTVLQTLKELQLDFLSALPHGAIPILALLPGLTRVDRMHHRFWTDHSQPKILFNFLHFDNEPDFESLFDGLRCEHIQPRDTDNALNEINLFVRCEGPRIRAWLGCWKSRYSMATVQEMSEAYQRLLIAIVSDPDRRMGELLDQNMAA